MNEECHTTIILTSHDMDDISSVCDELIVIDKGKNYFAGVNGCYFILNFLILNI